MLVQGNLHIFQKNYSDFEFPFLVDDAIGIGQGSGFRVVCSIESL